MFPQLLFSTESLLFDFGVYCYIREMSILVVLVPSDADGDGDDGDGGVPTTLPAWQGPRGVSRAGIKYPVRGIPHSDIVYE